MLEIKNIAIEMKNAFDGLTGRLDTVKERIREFEYMSAETSKTEMQRGKKKMKKTQQNTQELWGYYKKC